MARGKGKTKQSSTVEKDLDDEASASRFFLRVLDFLVLPLPLSMVNYFL